MSVDKELVELYLADNFEALRELVRSKDIQELKRIERLPVLAQGLFKDLLRSLDDQEIAYITGSRYLNFMDHALRYSADKIFLELRYGSEYQKVKSIMSDLEAELIDRYDERAYNRGKRRSGKRGSSGHSSDEQQSDIVYIQPTSPGSGDSKQQSVSVSIFISTVELYDALMKNANILIVDMRDPADYQESRIMTPLGHSVNIPEDIVIPGLSANTLGQLLTEEAQEVWNERDNFEMIVLLDWDTDNFNFSGSRLERLRCCIVEWDLNRNYTQLPVVLNGGFKEFLECYPSEVTNCHIFLSRTNSEIDDLLTIDNVSYPDAGSGGNINLKVRTIASFADIQARIQRDFGDLEITTGPPARPSRSEGQLPRDYYSSQEGKSPYKSLSQESLPRDYIASDTFVEPLPFPALEFPRDEDVEATPAEVVADVKAEGDDMAAEIKIAIDAEKAEMLSRVRALKPKSPRDDPKDVIIRNLIQENKGLFARPAEPPAIDRSFKPARVVVTKEGYTGIRNIRNNCYVSCMMQCLKVLPLIKSMFVMSNEYKHHVHKESPIVVLEFAMLMKSLWEGSTRKPKCYNPDDFLQKVYELNPIYARGNHEDTFEYFILLFNNLSDDCSVELPHRKIMTETERSWYSQLQGRSSFFVDMFYYQLRNTKVCWRCQKINYVFDNDSTLMVSISENKGQNRVEDLLKEFLKDNLVPDYSCSECKHSATIVNKKAIVVEPEILVIIIKRYTATKDGSIKKNETEITFPVDKLEFGNSYYKLYAIPQHTGTMMVGHYFASVLLNDVTNTWVQFNDERILSYATPITDVPGIKSSCVGFFYVRQAQKISEPQTECDKESFK